jgi:hypothetical protein
VKNTLTRREREVLLIVVRGWVRAGTWHRAHGSGQRPTLASLYRKGLLSRRAWRGVDGEADAAHEYRPSVELIEALRNSPVAPAATSAPSPSRVEGGGLADRAPIPEPTTDKETA